MMVKFSLLKYFNIYKIPFIYFFIFFSFTFEYCYDRCKTCSAFSNNYLDMKCLSCIDNYYFLYNTSNCVDRENYLNYYINKTNNILYPCS